MPRLRRWGLVVVLSLAFTVSEWDRGALAEPRPAERVRSEISGGATDRVAFVPRLGSDLTHGPGRLCRCQAGSDGRPRDCACDPRDPAREALMPHEGVTVQNLGDRPTRFMFVGFLPGFADGSCEDCGFASSVCSPDVPPGMTWTFSPYVGPEGTAPSSGATSAVLYSLSADVAAAVGPEWTIWLRDRGLDPDTRLGDLACRFVAAGDYGPAAPEPGTPAGTDRCSSYALFHAAFVAGDGRLPGTELSMAPVRGAAMAAVAAAVTSAGSPDRVVIDRTEAVGWPEVGPDDVEGSRRYVAPGGSGRTEDGSNSVLSVQNAGATCAVARVQPHRARFGAFGEPVQLTVPPGRRVEIDVGAAWPALRQGASLVVGSEGLLAATLTNQGAATSSTVVARRERSSLTRWLVPRAYQEERRLPLLAAGPSRAEDLSTAEGWQTNLAIYNPADARVMATLRFQAAGQAPRPLLDYPVESESQIVLQPGFGLGPDGGPGWAEVTSSEAALTVSSESLRAARGVPGLAIEAWGASAYPLEGRSEGGTIGLPSLGGPAVGAMEPMAIVSPTERLTGTMVTLLSLQNPLTVTARVAIDSYGQGCGYVGTIERSLDPRQALTVHASELPGTAFGADSAVVRILAGDVAVLVETSRTSWLAAAPGAVPPDLTTAYLGTATDGPGAAPSPPTAVLEARPASVDVQLGDTAVEASLALEDSAGSGRCLSVHAVSDASWLRITAPRTAVPGQLRFRIEPDALGARGSRRATITLTGEQPNVEGSPLTVDVTVTRAGPPAVFLPSVARAAGHRQ